MASSADKNTFDFELISPTKVEVKGFEERVVIPGDQGDFVVLPGHTRLISNMRSGIVRVIRNDQDAHQIYVSGGYVDISPDSCTILTPEAVPIHQLNKGALEERLALLQSDLDEKEDKDNIEDIKNEISDIKLKLSVLANAG